MVQILQLLTKFYMLLHGFVVNFVRKLITKKTKLIERILFFSYSHLKEPQKTLESMLNTKITLFPGHIQSVYYQNILKIIIYLIQSSNNDETLIQQLLSLTIDKMSLFLSSGDVEAQERVGHVSFYFKGHQDKKLHFSDGR